MNEETATIADRMNRALYLQPALVCRDERPLVDALRRDIDETAARARRRVDREERQALNWEAERVLYFGLGPADKYLRNAS